jgi:hypothetical protein
MERFKRNEFGGHEIVINSSSCSLRETCKYGPQLVDGDDLVRFGEQPF